MGDVIFAPVSDKSPPEVIKSLIKAEDYLGDVKKGDYAGIKLHVGELGNKSHIKPEIVKVIVAELKRRGAKPFLFDCNSLYRGKRWNAVDHHENAYKNGFTYEVVGAPFMVGDGIRGMDETDVEIKDLRYESAHLGKIIEDIDYLFVLTHFKFHELFGYGGAIKNIGMGMASRRGKLFLHSDIKPDILASKCTACGACAVTCPINAITVGEVANIDKDTCIGCGMCVVACKYGAIEFEWSNTRECVIKTLHYAKAVIGKIKRCVYLNVLTDITPHCDCYGYTKDFVVEDIGFLYSNDIVSIDAASADLVDKAEPLEGSRFKRKELAKTDKVKAIFDIDMNMDEFFETAQKIGLGSRSYNLVEKKF
ncbi:DUF362 domain-containing protein [candidate division WOR-3 bacterium]|nr:DUF362 domain-containing protein [candidate division WOR-3 bacterium]